MILCGKVQEVSDRVGLQPDQFVESRQRGGELRAAYALPVPERQEGLDAARVRGVYVAGMVLETRRMPVGLPAGCSPGSGNFPENRFETLAGEPHLALGPDGIAAGDVVLPAHVVPAVDADLETRVARRAHRVRALAADVRPRQERAVEEGADAVVFQDRRPFDLREEPWAKNAAQRAAGVVRPEAEEERGAGAVAFQYLH